MDRISISARLPEFTLKQIEDLKNFYELDSQSDPTAWRPTRSRIIIICVNAFWKKIFEEKHELSDLAEKARNRYSE